MVLATLVILAALREAAPAHTAPDGRATVREALVALEKALSGIESYACILESFVLGFNGEKEEKTYEYAFVKPGYVKMKVIKGPAGEAFYDPTTGKVRGRKPGMLSAVRLTLSPDDSRVKSVRGHRIDETSWFFLLDSWKSYVERADSVVLEARGDTLVLMAFGIPENPYKETAMKLFLDKNSHLPLGFEAYDANANLTHRVFYRDVRLNPGLKPEDLRF